jgi:hypothetical protein
MPDIIHSLYYETESLYLPVNEMLVKKQSCPATGLNRPMGIR